MRFSKNPDSLKGAIAHISSKGITTKVIVQEVRQIGAYLHIVASAEKWARELSTTGGRQLNWQPLPSSMTVVTVPNSFVRGMNGIIRFDTNNVDTEVNLHPGLSKRT